MINKHIDIYIEKKSSSKGNVTKKTTAKICRSWTSDITSFLEDTQGGTKVFKVIISRQQNL